jgi:CHAT domain-containing protein/Tfp pilus assembly protein PilF
MRATKEQKMGDESFNEHRYTEAIAHYTKMLEASRKLGIYRNRSMESEVSRKVADGFEMIGNYEEALNYVKQAITLDSVDKNVFNMIDDYRHDGNIRVFMGRYYMGIASLERSLSLCEGMDQSLKNTHRLLIAETYLSLAQIYAVMGRSSNALYYTEKALSIFISAGEARGEMESYLTLGTIYSDQGDILTSRKFIEHSLSLAKEIKLGTSRQYQLLASLESSMGEYENAIRFQEMALDESRKLGIVAQIIWAEIGMGDIYRDVGDLSHAEKFYNSAKEARSSGSVSSGSLEASIGLRLGDPSGANRFFSSQGSVQGKAISSLRMAEVMMQESKTDTALFLLNQAAGGFRTVRNVQGLTNVQVLMGKLYVDQDKSERAEKILDSALTTTGYPEMRWRAFYQKGRMYEKEGLDDRAIESYRNSVNVIEKMRGNLTIDEFKSSFIESKRDVYDRLINLLQKNNDPAGAFQVSEQDRARSFYDILANRKIDFRGSKAGDLISREQEKRIEMQKLSRLIQRSEAGDSTNDPHFRSEILHLRNELSKVQSEYEDLLQELKLSNPSYNEMVSARLVNLADLQNKLDRTAASVVYWISDNQIIIWLVTSKEVYSTSVEINSSDLSSLVEKTRRSIQSNKGEESDRDLASLYTYLIQPVEGRLAGITNLVIIPNGPLHFLPFQALRNGKGEYMVQLYNIIYEPSAGVYILCNERVAEQGSRFLGFALSEVSVGGKAGLPGTGEEVRKILEIFPDNLSAFGANGSETFVKKNAGRFNFIHFATHGSYNFDQPLYSCLLFPASEEDDGRLNVYEVLEMNLNAKLVTLSACETGLGNLNRGDELIGLSRAFLFAGSSSVLVSLWAVADYQTSMLMTSFYSHLKDHTVQEALTLAQREVIKKFPQPLYWSPFILIGNGTVTAD